MEPIGKLVFSVADAGQESPPSRCRGQEGTAAIVRAFCKHHGLSRRESAVVTLLAHGLNPKAIAHELSCTPSTTTTYLRRLLRKLACCCQDKHEIAPTLLFLALAGSRIPCRRDLQQAEAP